MKTLVKRQVFNLKGMRSEAVILPIFKDEWPKAREWFSAKSFSSQLTRINRNSAAFDTPGIVAEIVTPEAWENRLIILVSLGKRRLFKLDVLRHLAGDFYRFAQARQIRSLTVTLQHLAIGDPEGEVQAIIEGARLGSYVFNVYKTKAKAKVFPSMTIEIRSRVTQGIRDAVIRGETVGDAVNFARDLANTPSNDLTPTIFMEKVKAEFHKVPLFKVEVIDEKQAEKLGMGSFLCVTQGSPEPAYMLCIRYQPKSTQKPIAIVGKGVTFDTGGISIKPSMSMSEMKGDMSGAAAVFATMRALKALKPNRPIIAMIPLTDNMPSATAVKPGDVVKAMNGKTIEILNTDAEGRLILADALTYAAREGAEEIVDIATLTGACSVALGPFASGVMGNQRSLIERLEKIGDAVGERLWPFPMYDEYLGLLKSQVADIANCSEGRKAGTSTAAKFLEQFIEKAKWAHLDIASTMTNDKTKGYHVEGMSGAGTRILISYCM